MSQTTNGAADSVQSESKLTLILSWLTALLFAGATIALLAILIPYFLGASTTSPVFMQIALICYPLGFVTLIVSVLLSARRKSKL